MACFRLILVCFLWFALLAMSYGREMNPKALSLSNDDVSHVCHPSRFMKLGLEMSKFAYCDSSLSYEVRAKDLVDRMTLAEKVQQTGNTAAGVARIGLPKYEWWSEALHGVSNVGPGTIFDDVVPGATSFPVVLLTAASFNQSLWKNIGEIVSTEARAMYNLGRAGLTFWSPNINVVRDPRWGRCHETPGEDPYVVGVYATNYVRGLQDVKGTENTTDLNSRPLKVASCCKHYAAYDLDSWLGVDRFHFNAKVTEQDMMETFLRPFEMCVKDGDVSSVMCSFNRVNGIPTCADPNLLKGLIRGEWDLHEYIVADCDSVEVIVDYTKFLGDNKEQASSQTLTAGLDLDCGTFYPESLQSAVRAGLIKESDIDRSLRYLYVVLMRLGFFDGSPEFQSLGKDDVCSAEHVELAAQAAREGIVLLKNDDDTLPLDINKVNSIAIVGPHGNATTAMIGNYAGVPCKMVSPFDAFSAIKNKKVTFETGCSNVTCVGNDGLIFTAMESTKNADATLLFVGLDLSIEAEWVDRKNLLLPGDQTDLINQVAATAKGPVVLVIMSGGGVDITFAKNNPKIKSILWVGYPGEKGGQAIADVVFGNYNPGGRLPMTWYEADYVDQIPMTSMQLRPVESLNYPGRTYRFFNGSTVYPFGYGMSYTKFAYKLVSSTQKLDFKLENHQHCRVVNYSDPKFKSDCPAAGVDQLSCEANTVTLEVAVQNVGDKDGSEVVLVYAKAPQGIVGTSIKKLIAFERVFVAAGGTQNVKLELDPCKSFNIIQNTAYNVLPSGIHGIEIGNNATIATTLQVNLHH
ncbi:hypothetical protein FEM48_Zijuj05G0102100 [Ziziphus jujuba var. spinosa]|uniref:Fibronectin type III-like domain-containing protein n=1 Tax=Ziziphus jujuba var. spinosa TaxID=714518 RepID=A0A978VED0_ZIZJJ|nr:hypothetical protein FEM48_Zijuj05G0102100 [Ziziphus jujuba var. spinosa]